MISEFDNVGKKKQRGSLQDTLSSILSETRKAESFSPCPGVKGADKKLCAEVLMKEYGHCLHTLEDTYLLAAPTPAASMARS